MGSRTEGKKASPLVLILIFKLLFLLFLPFFLEFLETSIALGSAPCTGPQPVVFLLSSVCSLMTSVCVSSWGGRVGSAITLQDGAVGMYLLSLEANPDSPKGIC